MNSFKKTLGRSMVSDEGRNVFRSVLTRSIWGNERYSRDSSFRVLLQLSCVIGSLLSTVLCLFSSHSACFAGTASDSGSSAKSLTSSNRSAEKKVWIRVSPKRCDFLVFTKAGQGLVGNFASASEISLVASLGTVVSIDKNTTLMHNGSLFLACRKGTAVINTRSGMIRIPEKAAALIEVNPANSSERVLAFSKDPKSMVQVTVRKSKESSFLHDEQECSFCGKESATIKVSDFDKTKTEFAEASTALVPTDKVILGVHEAPLHMLGADATEFRCAAPDTISLRTGQVFTQVSHPLTIQTAVADAVLGKGALVDLDADSELMRLKSFSQSGHAAVICGKQKFEVLPGQELLVSSRRLDDSDHYPTDGIGRRRPEPIKVENRLFASICDFSMISFLHQCDHVDAIKRALNNDMKELRDKILKTASAVHVVTNRYGSYRASPKSARKRAPKKSNTSA